MGYKYNFNVFYLKKNEDCILYSTRIPMTFGSKSLYFCTESKSYNNNNNKNLFNSLLYCLRENHVIDFENLLILYAEFLY